MFRIREAIGGEAFFKILNAESHRFADFCGAAMAETHSNLEKNQAKWPILGRVGFFLAKVS